MIKAFFWLITQRFHKESLKLLTLTTVLVLNLTSVSGQPNWSAGQPIVTPHPIYLDLSFDLNINANVYWVVFPYTLSTSYPASTIKSWAGTTLPFGDLIQNGIFSFTTPGTVQNVRIGGLPITQMVTSNHNYTVVLVAESSPGVFSTVVFKYVTTPPCPPVYLLTGFPIPSVCVNKGTLAIFTIELPDTDPLTPGKQTDVNGTGIYAGTTWSLNWGDGTTNTYTSTADNDIPTAIGFITHTYTTAANCVYNVTLTVRNPCGEIGLVTYPIDVHGRDQGDNDGQLIIEDVASGETAVVEVCEGSEHILTMRDISDWNCQNPTFPDGTPAPPNDEPRTIQWVYGEDNGGGIQNTIGTTLGTLAPVIIGGDRKSVV